MAKKPKADRPDIPAYIDRKNRKGLLAWTWAEKILDGTRNYFFASTRSDGRPHVMPVWGVWLNNRFYFSTGKKSVKARNLAGNSHCVLCAGDAAETVIIEGAAEKVTSKTVLKKIAAKYIRKYDMDPLSMNEPIFVVRPAIGFGQIEKTFEKTATRWKF